MLVGEKGNDGVDGDLVDEKVVGERDGAEVLALGGGLEEGHKVVLRHVLLLVARVEDVLVEADLGGRSAAVGVNALNKTEELLAPHNSLLFPCYLVEFFYHLVWFVWLVLVLFLCIFFFSFKKLCCKYMRKNPLFLLICSFVLFFPLSYQGKMCLS